MYEQFFRAEVNGICILLLIWIIFRSKIINDNQTRNILFRRVIYSTLILIFADFAPNGMVDGNVWFYEIETKDVYGLVLNERKGETFADQQRQVRRPRFSMKSLIINKKHLKPIKKINLMEE